MASVLTEIKTYCSRCGRQTWWYQELGPKPLCERCWDQDVGGTIITARTGIEPLLLPVELAADKRAYYQAHRVEIAADKDHNTILEFQANFMREHTGYSFSKQPHAGRHQLTPLPAPA